MPYIYCLRDPRPDDLHCYIGKAANPQTRFIEHRSKLNFERTHKANWWRSLAEIGLEPVLEVLKEVPISQWEQWERDFIRWYRVLGWKVVNTCDGGEGGARPATPETCAKISAANKGKPKSEAYKQGRREHYAKFGHPSQGKKLNLTSETRAAISAANKGKRRSAETRAKMSASGGHHLRGKRQSSEHIAKCRAAKVGKKFTAEHSAKIGAALRGKPKSDEARRKMSIAAKARCERERLTAASAGASLLP